jgi:A118 family predicted phage portal protein
LYKEYNPEIRIDTIKDVFETCLSLLSMSFGYGTKKYTFENGQIKTATEYIGERQDAMQELNKQRAESEAYIKDIIRAVIWFSNEFKGTNWNIDEEINIAFDDSYVNDKQSEIENMRMDAIQFPNVPEFTVQYVMLRLNCERDEAIKYIQSDLMNLEQVEE